MKTEVLKFSIYILTFLLMGGWCPAQTQLPDSLRTVRESTKNNEQDSLKNGRPLVKVDSSLLAQHQSYDQNIDLWNGGEDSIQLSEVFIIAPLKFKNFNDRREYLILRRKVKRVWPYAVLASTRLNSLNDRLGKIDSKYGKQRYTKRVQRYLEGKFKERLKHLSKTEGQILVKLLYRQTGETTYELIRNLRSGWRAFRYNMTAHLFTISLKEKYDPAGVKEDYYIEHILLRGFQNHQFEEQDPAIDIDYSNIVNKWE